MKTAGMQEQHALAGYAERKGTLLAAVKREGLTTLIGVIVADKEDISSKIAG